MNKTDAGDKEKIQPGEMNKNNLKKLLRAVLLLAAGLAAMYFFSPEKTALTIKMSAYYGKEMILILPAVLIIMGLADVWLPKSLIKKYLGSESGIKGLLIAVFLGTLPAGPMYIAFPIAAELLKKKASVFNVIVFLGVWASLKIPQIGVELQFLGVKFAVFRFALTLMSVISIALIIERVTKKDIEAMEPEKELI